MTVRCPICEAERPARRVGALTFVECSSCGAFAYDRHSAAALRADPDLRKLALSSFAMIAQISPDQVGLVVWKQEAIRLDQTGGEWSTHVGWMKRPD